MKKILLLVLFTLSGCATVENPEYVTKEEFRQNIIKLDYYINHDGCFIRYNKCMVEKKPNCWAVHEKCVIEVSRRYRGFLQ